MNGTVLKVRVKAGSGQFSISKKADSLEIRTRSPAEGNRANMEIVKELSRLFGRDVRIVRGLKSKRKEILIPEISPGEVQKILMK
jgi:uncharacterized protein (TIGR00251 family)